MMTLVSIPDDLLTYWKKSATFSTSVKNRKFGPEQTHPGIVFEKVPTSGKNEFRVLSLEMLCADVSVFIVRRIFEEFPGVMSSEYERIRRQCLKRGELWEDTEFPTTQTSIFYHQSPPFQFVWKRPKVK